jgi:hypothetical protein
MAQKLLTEFFELCKDGICQDLLTEREKKEVSNGATYLSGRIQAADTPNGNGRVYPKKVLETEIKNYLKIVKDNRATGELDHPEDSVVNLKNVSHLMIDVWWQGNDVMGKMKVLDTPSGRILKDLMNAGVKLGISSRGLGTVKEGLHGHDVVEEDFQLICFDIVSEPSTAGAFVHPEEKREVSTFRTRMQENKQNQIDSLFDRILRD